jgi:hypothetical protein
MIFNLNENIEINLENVIKLENINLRLQFVIIIVYKNVESKIKIV